MSYCVRFREDHTTERDQRAAATHQRKHHHRRGAAQQASQATPLLRATGRHILRQPYPQADTHGEELDARAAGQLTY